ncbi:hypothetical protein EBU94_07155 [bacterium]|nr:hypothetical protein [bacterium]
MTAMDWAKKKEALLLEKRAKCPWILEHTRMRNFTLETFNVSRSGLIHGPTPQQPLSFKELDKVPACDVYCTSNAPKIPNPYGRVFRRIPQHRCEPYCHYRFKKEVDDH